MDRMPDHIREPIALLRLQAERYEALAKAAPAGSGARKAAEVTVRVTREAIAWYETTGKLARDL